jgi:hypothetical protein
MRFAQGPSPFLEQMPLDELAHYRTGCTVAALIGGLHPSPKRIEQRSVTPVATEPCVGTVLWGDFALNVPKCSIPRGG